MEDWLTISDAAEKLKISERTIYRRIDQGIYKSKKGEGGRRLVYLTDDIIQSSQTELSSSLSEELQKENEWLRQQVSDLTSLLQRREAELDANRYRQDEIHASLARQLERSQRLLEYKKIPWYKRIFKRKQDYKT